MSMSFQEKLPFYLRIAAIVKANKKRHEEENGKMVKKRQIHVFVSLVNLCIIGFLILLCPQSLIHQQKSNPLYTVAHSVNYCHPLKPHQWNSAQAQGYVSDSKMQTFLHCLFILFGAFRRVQSPLLLPNWCDLAGGRGRSEILPKGRIIYWWPYDDEVVNKHKVVK